MQDVVCSQLWRQLANTLRHSNKRGAKRNLKKSKNWIHNQPNCGLLLATVQLKASLWISMQDVVCFQLWQQLTDCRFDTQTSEARKETWKSPKIEFTINQTGLTFGIFWNKSESLDKYARCCMLSTVTAICGLLLWHSNKQGAKRNLKKSKNWIHNQPNCGLLLATVQLKASLWTSMQDVVCFQLWQQLADWRFDTHTCKARKETWKSPKMEFTINQTVASVWKLSK